MSLNKFTAIGNLGRDPEVRNLNNGKKVVSFSLATTDSWKDKASGEWKNHTEWHNVVIFNENLGGVAERFLKKGSKAYIEGKLKTRKFTDKNGAERSVVEIVMEAFNGAIELLDKKEGGSAPAQHSDAPADDRSAPAQKAQPQSTGRLASNDDIPF
jgi:single-strand DNA-binding protein